jgi:hypothetical protein
MNITELIKLIFDNDKSLGQKALLFSLIFIFAFIFDLTFNISFDSHYSTKLDNLEKITRLKESYRNDTVKLKQICNYENTVITTRHYSEFLSDVILSIHLNSNDIRAKKSFAEITDINIKNRIIIWHFILSIITSSLVPILILIFTIILLPFGLLIKAEKFMLGWLAVFSISLMATILLSLISLLIPIIFGEQIINYFINLLFQAGLIYLIIRKIN